MKLYELLGNAVKGDPERPFLSQDVQQSLAKIDEEAKNLTHILNSVANPYSQSGSCGDFGNANNSIFIPDFGNNFSRYQHEIENLYYGVGEAKRIIDMPVQDMLRDEFLFTGLDDDETKNIVNYLERLNFHEILERALICERLYGGSAIFIGLNDYSDSAREPINYSSVTPGDVAYLNVINRWDITNVDIETDPTKPEYERPTHYYIHGKPVARNRLLVFDGQPLYTFRGNVGSSFVGNQAELWKRHDGFGFPVLLRLRADILRAVGVREAAYHLAERASVMVFKGDIGSQAMFKDGNNALNNLQRVLQLLSNYRAAVVNNSPTNQADLMTLSANFGALPELITTYLQILGANADMQATIMLGDSPSGLNATGESDLSLWEKNILGKQRRLRPELNKFLPILLPSCGIAKPASEVSFDFAPLWEAGEQESADIRTKNIDNTLKLVDARIYSNEDALEELKVRESISHIPESLPPEIDYTQDPDNINMAQSNKNAVQDNNIKDD